VVGVLVLGEGFIGAGLAAWLAAWLALPIPTNTLVTRDVVLGGRACGGRCATTPTASKTYFWEACVEFALIHRSAWNRYSRKFAMTEFCELRLLGILRSSHTRSSKKFGMASESNRGRSLDFTARRDRPVTSPRYRALAGVSVCNRRRLGVPSPRPPGSPPEPRPPWPARSPATQATDTRQNPRGA
jgi:hypothetical protein